MPTVITNPSAPQSTPRRPGRALTPILLALLFLTVLPLTGASLDDGLIAFYPFNGNALDASPTAAHGTVLGPTLTTDRYDRPDQAYLFDGVNDWINIGNLVKPDFPVTVAAWIYSTADDAEEHTIFRSGTFNNLGSWNGILLGFSQGRLYTYIGSGPYGLSTWCRQHMPTTGVIPANQWTHVAVAWIGWNTMAFYVNGTLQNSRYDGWGTGTTIVNSSSDGAIGLRDYSYSSPWSGKLDELRVYSRELSSDEVHSLAFEPPEVTLQPSTVVTNAGSSVAFSAIATGALPLNYRWQHNDTDLTGATNSSLTLTDVRAGNQGTYRVIVTNPVGTNTALATLTVTETTGATCSMPSLFTNSIPFTVSIRVLTPNDTYVYAVEDQPPAGWAVSQISDGGTFGNGKVQWTFFDGAIRDLTYLLTPPPAATGIQTFAGNVNFNGTDIRPITGTRSCQNETVGLAAGIVNLGGNAYARLTLTGRSGASYNLLVADALESPNPWSTLKTFTLSGTTTNWVDSQSVGKSRRFYRAQGIP